MKQEEIYLKIETRLPDYDIFENAIMKSIHENYFILVYQSIYNQIGYDNFSNQKFNTEDFKSFLTKNNFVDFVNEMYRTRISSKGMENIRHLVQQVDSFDDYEKALMIFEKSDRRNLNGKVIKPSPWSFGTKLLHFYNPQENPILDTIVRDNLKIGYMDAKVCMEFRKAANCFINKHDDYFDKIAKSENIKKELEERYIPIPFSKMGLLDMALY